MRQNTFGGGRKIGKFSAGAAIVSTLLLGSAAIAQVATPVTPVIGLLEPGFIGLNDGAYANLNGAVGDLGSIANAEAWLAQNLPDINANIAAATAAKAAVDGNLAAVTAALTTGDVAKLDAFSAAVAQQATVTASYSSAIESRDAALATRTAASTVQQTATSAFETAQTNYSAALTNYQNNPTPANSDALNAASATLATATTAKTTADADFVSADAAFTAASSAATAAANAKLAADTAATTAGTNLTTALGANAAFQTAAATAGIAPTAAGIQNLKDGAAAAAAELTDAQTVLANAQAQPAKLNRAKQVLTRVGAAIPETATNPGQNALAVTTPAEAVAALTASQASVTAAGNALVNPNTGSTYEIEVLSTLADHQDVLVNHEGRITGAETAISALQANDLAMQGQISNLNQRVDKFDDRLRSATAVAVAMSGGAFLPDKVLNVTFNLGHYDGKSAASGQIGYLVSPNVALNAGFATSFHKGGKSAFRTGVTFGF